MSSRTPWVRVHHNRNEESLHERVTHLELGRWLARLLGYHFAEGQTESPFYLLPTATLLTNEAQALGIYSQDDLFGGVVPESFVAGKAISHPLIPGASCVPRGWSEQFAIQTAQAVLTGYSAFCVADALRAGEKMLARGPLRVKAAESNASRGQWRVENRDALQRALANIASEALARSGVVLEEQLDTIETLSIGECRLPTGLNLAYLGRQKSVENHSREAVYGGSRLKVVQGRLHDLLHLALSEQEHQAVLKTITFDQAADTCYPGFYASRRNYDVAIGQDVYGRPCIGVLEQSWRIGGATGAELAALATFQKNPHLTSVIASSHECYHPQQLPKDAKVLFSALDPQTGYISKYVVVESA